MAKNLKFKLIKLENHVVIQFDHIDETITKLNRAFYYKPPIKEYRKPFDIKRTKKTPYNQLEWSIKIFIKNVNHFYAGAPYYGGSGTSISRRIDKRYIKFSIDPNEKLLVTKMKFRDNTERDSFCEAFIDCMKTHVSPTINKLKTR